MQASETSSPGPAYASWNGRKKRPDRLPSPDLRITLEHAVTGRKAYIAGETEQGKLCLEELVA